MSDEHDHYWREFAPPGPDPLGRPVDGTLLGQFIAAAMDSCATCQESLIALLAEDAATTARLVELACLAMHSALGGLPPSAYDPEAPGMASVEFRELARLGMDGQNDRLVARCREQAGTQRRSAIDTASNILVGLLK